MFFAGSAEGAHRACVLLGIVATCRAIGVPVQAYLAWAFERLGTHRDVFGSTWRTWRTPEEARTGRSRPDPGVADRSRSNLDIQFVAKNIGDEVQSIAPLSGGEAFLASLALPLGLSESTRANSEVFATLDSEAFEVAMSALDALQASGCIIGVTSHVEGLADRAEVLPRGGGLCRVRVVAPGP